MPSKFLETSLATDWQTGKPIWVKIVDRIFFFIPRANPGYDSNLHLIDRWFIEFDENDDPSREIGISKSGEVVVAGPSDRNYGFWCDTNMKYSDFNGEEISESDFENLWLESKTFRSDDA